MSNKQDWVRMTWGEFKALRDKKLNSGGGEGDETIVFGKREGPIKIRLCFGVWDNELPQEKT